jgi:hypothetical protein
MDIYDNPTAVGGEFTDGDPAGDPPVPRTVLSSLFCNMIQRELIALVEGSGQTLDPDNDAQVLAAINLLITVLEATIEDERLGRRHTSAELAIVQGATVTSAHGFGVVPYSFSAQLICKVAEHGYAIGEILDISVNFSNNSQGVDRNANGVQVSANDTIIRGVVGEDIVTAILDTSGESAQITPANWRIVLVANK